MRRFSFVVACALALAAAGAESGEVRKARRKIANRYIVVLNPAPPGSLTIAGAEALAETHAAQYGMRTRHVYRHALNGYAAEMTELQAASLADNPMVAYVEEDGVVEAYATQSGATWGLDRIDQRDLPLSMSYTYNFDGSGVHAYVIDTGVRTSHSEFTGRIGNGFTAIDDVNGVNDCNGHGTHVAGTIGGTTWGVAKRVTIHPVRVLGCTGQGAISGVIAGVDWVRDNHVKPAVANMSLGGGASQALDTALTNAIAAGVTFAVAAGNSNNDACGGSPARLPAAITVGASTRTDTRASFSSFGTCVDVFAPGLGITSAWLDSDTATNTISGTSMATPHVAGVVALYLSQNGQTAPATVASALIANATLNKLTGDLGAGSPNRLLFSIFGGGAPTPTPTTGPTATPTARPTATPTARPTATPTTRPTATATPVGTATPAPTPTATRTPPTPTRTPIPTATPTRTVPVPTVSPTPTPTPRPTPGNTVEVTPDASRVSTSAAGSQPGNVVDNNLLTRWSAFGDGQWLQFDLGTFRRVTHAKIAVASGNLRNARFDLQVSYTGRPGTWRTVFSGQSSGTTRQEETYDFPDAVARYVRFVGHGSTVPAPSSWNSLTEVSLFATR